MQGSIVGYIDVQLLRAPINIEQERTCKFNGWCFGQAFLDWGVTLLVEVDDKAFVVRLPAWICRHCEEFELPDWAKLSLLLSLDDFVQKHDPRQIPLTDELAPKDNGVVIVIA